MSRREFSVAEKDNRVNNTSSAGPCDWSAVALWVGGGGPRGTRERGGR